MAAGKGEPAQEGESKRRFNQIYPTALDLQINRFIKTE